jgi:CRISPR-associated protein Cas1
MLSLPDFREKQILFIESYQLKEISFLNENLTIKEEGKIVQQVPFHKIFSVFIIGNCTLTSVFIKKCMKYGIILILMEKNFAVYSVIGGETEGNFLLREKQYFCENNLEQAQWIVKNKIFNQTQLLKNIRQKTKEERESIKKLQTLQQKINFAQDFREILGLEGNASKTYFQTYFQDMNWRGRKPRTKYDEINVLFDIGYTYLFNFIDSHLRLYGFDTYKGFYHTEFYQRKSLTCDLVEPFRCLIDESIRKAHNLKQFDLKDFEIRNNEYHLKKGNGKKYAKIFLEAIMERKEEIFVYLQSYYRTIMKGKDDFPNFQV